MSALMLGSLYTGALVRLGAIKADEKEALSRWSHDGTFMRYLFTDANLPRPPAYYEEKEKDDEDRSSIRFGIRTLADDKLIGVTGMGIAWSHQSSWFWIGIGEGDYRNKGYGTDATRLMVGYAFRELGLFRINLGVFGYNQRAIRAYEKAGFIHEGAQREALYRDGKHWDMHMMGILRPEWEAQIAAAATGSDAAAEAATLPDHTPALEGEPA